MTTNDVLRSLRFVLNVTDAGVLEILRLGGGSATTAEITAYLKKDEQQGYLPCPDEVMARFLSGLIISRRGKDESRPNRPLELPVTNNTVLKAIRVAFELKDTDIMAIIEKAGHRVAKAELGAFFRKSDHRNYRECGDQFLRYLLKGLASP